MIYNLLPHDLHLVGVKFGDDGKVNSGYVMNGHWYFIRKNGIEYACRDDDVNSAVTQWPERDHVVIEIQRTEEQETIDDIPY